MVSNLLGNKALLFTLANAVIFQLGWFVCILLGNIWALSFTALAFIFHFYGSRLRLADAIAVIVAVVVGLIHDSILLHGGHILFTETREISPFWLICLWGLLGINVNHSLIWIYRRPLLAGLLGAICGPLTYLAGIRLSSAEWTSPLIEVVPLISVLWLFVLPLHRLLCMRILGYVQDYKIKLSC